MRLGLAIGAGLLLGYAAGLHAGLADREALAARCAAQLEEASDMLADLRARYAWTWRELVERGP